ncbi:MAG: family 78 glycoside hydrolase catalytic domain, partial [Gemmatimonadota bacterium]|nr:family 78 glycoside hydrolase catalytic domain [Gemmatimonadota bacterium]
LVRGAHLLWDSGRVESPASVFVPYAGPAGQSATRYWWRVRVWTAAGDVSPWSAPAYWETGLLHPSDWTAKWIGTPASPADTGETPSPLLRRDFTLHGRVARARLYVTSLGLYRTYIDGRRVGDDELAPGWTSYHHRLAYATYDVTALVRDGANTVGAMLGDGWYRGYLGFDHGRGLYGDRRALLLQLDVRYADGRTQTVVSDGSWTYADGPVRSADIYDGETYDARLERAGWDAPPYRDSTWKAVAVMAAPAARLVAPVAPPVKRVMELKPVSVTRAPDGEWLFDLGQNEVGWARLRASGPRGTAVTMRFGEVLDHDGNLYTGNLRRARQTDRYVMKGGGPETYEPHFTYHGFRYVALSGLPGTPDASTVTGIVVSSDLEQTGTFVTSDTMLNKLQHNIVWGQRGNFLSVPTDCPQRDERLGWTGDAQVFAPTAAFDMNVNGFLANWLADVAIDQHADGSLPWVIPNPMGGDSTDKAGTAGWGDAAVIVPWTLYLAYGDSALLARQYPSMRAWVDFEARQAGPSGVWRPGWQFGDWLAYHSTDAGYPGATTGTDLIATAYLAHSADLVARSARVLGDAADAAKYAALFEKERAAFDREFVTPAGRVGENTQTAYALALQFGLLPDSLRGTAGNRLAADVRLHDDHLTTGFLGTPNLLDALTRTGHLDVAYKLLLQRTYPSWLYPITRGATTMWERWDGIEPDGSFEDPSMNSFNHYAFGAVGSWMYRTIGGIAPDPEHPGYEHSIIAPDVGGGLDSARTSVVTPYGRLGSAWRIAGRTFTLDVTVPPNTWASVTLRNTTPDRVREGGRVLAGDPGVRGVRQAGADVVVDVGSGEYRFGVGADTP